MADRLEEGLEARIVAQLAGGLTVPQVAANLGLSTATVYRVRRFTVPERQRELLLSLCAPERPAGFVEA